LASVVAGDYPRFTLVHWLMAFVSLLLLVVVWDHLSRDALTFLSWRATVERTGIDQILE
jgi:hypothetical protein